MEDKFKDDIDLDEEQEARRRRPRRILFLAFGLIMAAALALARFTRDAAFVPAWALATPEPSATPAPLPSPAPTAAPSADPAADAATPPDGSGEAYQPTSIYIDGELSGVLASAEAAKAVITEVTEYFERRVTDVGIPITEIENAVEYRDATAEEIGSISTYETLYTFLTSDATPLRVVTTLSAQSTEIVPCETISETTDSLVKGTRRIVNMGRDGAMHSVTVSRYINGVIDGEPETTVAVISKLINGNVLEGTLKPDKDAEPSKKEGERGPDAGELSFIHPTVDKRITLNYGQYHGVLHLGLDYSAKEGDEVLASCGGTVVCAMERGGYGLMLELDHGNGFVTRYAHLSSISVELGDTVAQGDVIALAGSTGNCSGAMLHFELRVDSVPYNPRHYLT